MSVSPSAKRRRTGVIEPPKISEILSLESGEKGMEETEIAAGLYDAGFSEDIQTAFKGNNALIVCFIIIIIILLVNKIKRHHLYSMTHSTLAEMGIKYLILINELFVYF